MQMKEKGHSRGNDSKRLGDSPVSRIYNYTHATDNLILNSGLYICFSSEEFKTLRHCQ